VGWHKLWGWEPWSRGGGKEVAREGSGDGGGRGGGGGGGGADRKVGGGARGGLVGEQAWLELV
jgi:hypothetical protein